VEDGVAHVDVGVAVAPVLRGARRGSAGRRRSARWRRGQRPGGPWRGEHPPWHWHWQPPQRPGLAAQWHEEAQVPEQNPPRRQQRLAGAACACAWAPRPRGGDDHGRRRAVRRVERRRRRAPRRRGVGVRRSANNVTDAALAGKVKEAVVGEDREAGAAGQQRGARARRQAEVESVFLRRRPPHREQQLLGVHVNEGRRGAAERLAEGGGGIDDDVQALEGRPRLPPGPSAATGEAVAARRRRGLHGDREKEQAHREARCV